MQVNEDDGVREIFTGGSVYSLIIKFAVPTVTSLLVNSLYNIVDQIFIGYGVGFVGNAAVNVIFPVAIFSVAAASLIGDGAATRFSLCLGRDRPDEAVRCAVSAMAFAFFISFSILLTGQLFAPALAELLGVTNVIEKMALQYLRITLCGAPFAIIGSVLAALIRADGSPRYAMFCLLPGCVVNVVLDPVFIFILGWGVSGAAWATVIGQAVNFIIAARYISMFQTVNLNGFRQVSIHEILNISRLGSASFINQLSGTAYMVVINRYLAAYGAMSVYGPEIPLAAYGIVMKVNQIAMSVMHGTAVGMQPIISYCYSSRNYPVVKKCLRSAVKIVSVCGVVFFVIFQVFPRNIIKIFGEGNPLYMDFAVMSFRIFLFAVPLYGFSIVSTGLFQAIGKPAQSTFMALSRQIIYLLPLVVILAPLFGITGLLYAAPIGDILAFLTCLVLYRREICRLSG